MSSLTKEAEMKSSNRKQIIRQEIVYIKPNADIKHETIYNNLDLEKSITSYSIYAGASSGLVNMNPPKDAVAATPKVEPVEEDQDVKIIEAAPTSYKDPLNVCRLIYNTKKRSFQCNQCEYQSQYRRNVVEHLKYHKEVACWDQHLQKTSGLAPEPQLPMACHKCGYQTTDKVGFQQHLMLHMERKAYGCTNCDFKAYSESGLRRQLVLHRKRGDRSRVMLVMPQTKKCGSYIEQVLVLLYRCVKCEYETKSKAGFKQHMAAHLLEKPYRCTKCKFLAADGDTLGRHEAAAHVAETQVAFKTDLKARWGSIMKQPNHCSSGQENVD